MPQLTLLQHNARGEAALPMSAALASVSVGFCCSWEERRS